MERALEWTLCWPLRAVGWISPHTAGGRRAADGGGLILTWGRTFSRPSILVLWCLGGPRGRWELAPCQNSERMMASSRAIAAASLQNSQGYSTNGRSWWSRAMKQTTTSIAAEKKTGTKKHREKSTAQFLFFFGLLFCHTSHGFGTKRQGEYSIIPSLIIRDSNRGTREDIRHDV